MCFSKGAGGATSPSGRGISAFLISCTKYPGEKNTIRNETENCTVDLQLLLRAVITLQHQALIILLFWQQYTKSLQEEHKGRIKISAPWRKRATYEVLATPRQRALLPWAFVEVNYLQGPQTETFQAQALFKKLLTLHNTLLSAPNAICQKLMPCSTSHVWNKRCSNKEA